MKVKWKLPDWICTRALVPEVVEEAPQVGAVAAITTEVMNVLSQIERAGYSELADKLRETQGPEAVKALNSGLSQLDMLERSVQMKLERAALPGNEIDLSEMKLILKMVQEIFTMRAKMLLLPMGSVNPRALIPKQSMVPSKIGVGVSIGMTVGGSGGSIMPKRK